MQFRLVPENQSSSFDSPSIPVWVNVEVFEQWWSKDVDYFEPGTKNWMKATFFSGLESIPTLYIGRASISIKNGRECLYFKGGRHRTRWLLDMGVNPLPVALSPSALAKADEIGLLIRLMEEGEVLELPITLEQIQSEQIEYDNLLVDINITQNE